MTTVTFIAVVLLNTRYLRYIFPVFPLLALLLVYPLAIARGTYTRGVVVLAAVAGIALGVLRIPAAGWILGHLNAATAFSQKAKETLLDNEVPLRKLGRIEAALGDDESRVLVFGQSVGADIRGRPIYVSWYYPALQNVVFSTSSPEAAANTLAALNITHVIFDLSSVMPEWAAWQTAAERYGRLIARTPVGELYEFHADSAPATDIFGGPPGPWQRWGVYPEQENAVSGADLLLQPGAAASRPADLASVPDGTQVALSAQLVCDTRSTIRAQINWLHTNGSIIRSDAARSPCAETPARASVKGSKPKDAVAAYFYFTNDGAAPVRLYEERATALVRP